MEKLTDKNKKIKQIAKLKHKKWRKRLGLFLIEGEHTINEAIKRNLVKEVFSTKKEKNSIEITKKALKKISSLAQPKEKVAVCLKKETNKIVGNKILVFEKIDNPGNLGVICRNAVAFNFTDIVLSGVDIYNPKVIQNSQGAFFGINIIKTNNIENFIKEELANFLKVAAVSRMDSDVEKIYDFKAQSKKIAYFFGNETLGFSKKILELSVKKIYVPCSFESLSIVNAVAIFCFWHEYNEVNA